MAYIRDLYPKADIRGLISGAYVRGAFIRELMSGGLISGSAYPVAYIRGLISEG